MLGCGRVSTHCRSPQRRGLRMLLLHGHNRAPGPWDLQLPGRSTTAWPCRGLACPAVRPWRWQPEEQPICRTLHLRSVDIPLTHTADHLQATRLHVAAGAAFHLPPASHRATLQAWRRQSCAPPCPRTPNTPTQNNGSCLKQALEGGPHLDDVLQPLLPRGAHAGDVLVHQQGQAALVLAGEARVLLLDAQVLQRGLVVAGPPHHLQAKGPACKASVCHA